MDTRRSTDFGKSNLKSMLGIHPLGCTCQILYCTTLFFSHVASATLPAGRQVFLHHALFSIKFARVRSKSESPTYSNFAVSGIQQVSCQSVF